MFNFSKNVTDCFPSFFCFIPNVKKYILLHLSLYTNTQIQIPSIDSLKTAGHCCRMCMYCLVLTSQLLRRGQCAVELNQSYRCIVTVQYIVADVADLRKRDTVVTTQTHVLYMRLGYNTPKHYSIFSSCSACNDHGRFIKDCSFFRQLIVS